MINKHFKSIILEFILSQVNLNRHFINRKSEAKTTTKMFQEDFIFVSEKFPNRLFYKFTQKFKF